MMDGQNMMDCMGMMGGMGWVMMFFWILLLALVGWGLYRLFATRRSEAPARKTPLETLQHRYARGELSTEEYEERRQKLHDQGEGAST